ncbi:hypothetical protein GCM10023201_58400 [Actinomycetospora corticicola]|uniref:Large-conductance mechanosensitive channel n=1 Tax=Actinomycetospora corticicola TaxID=663602 RepID=A0A7Y9DSG7_9PSEU|nr:large conductance mechanosensitive channel protein [Actinomycetospora corticicola]
MLKGFKDFLLRGNVIDLSVAVVIGAAFTAVVNAFTDSFLKPLIQLLSPGGDQFRGTVRVSGVAFDYADFINQAITFLITAGVVYFLVVAPMKALQSRRLRGEEAGPAQPTDVELLTQIRDLLEDQATRGVPDDRRGPAPVPAPERAPAPAPMRPSMPPAPPVSPPVSPPPTSVPRRGHDAETAPAHAAAPPAHASYAAPAGRPTPPHPFPADTPPRHSRAGVR